MATLALKDKSGDEVFYEGVHEIVAPSVIASDGTRTTTTFTAMRELNSYYVIHESDGQYKIKGRAVISRLGGITFFDINESTCRTYGKLGTFTTETGGTANYYTVLVIMTPKTLTIGNTYAYTDLY